jgi:glycerophosphoryl diester phosphodiesterase
MSDSPLIIAHRGASARAPENTLAAIKMAIDANADGVEFDVQLASDGIPVVIHDLTLDRTSSITGKVSDLTSSDLGNIEVGSWFNARNPRRSNPNFATETIPTLNHVLEVLESFEGLIYIELKPNATNLCRLAKAVCDVVRSSQLMPQMILKSFDHTAIPEIKRHLPEVQTAALFQPTVIDTLMRRRDLIATTRKLGAHHISLHYSMATRKLAALAREAKLPMTVWTVDNPKWLEKCRQLRIGALITNDPEKLLKIRKQIYL